MRRRRVDVEVWNSGALGLWRRATDLESGEDADALLHDLPRGGVRPGSARRRYRRSLGCYYRTLST